MANTRVRPSDDGVRVTMNISSFSTYSRGSARGAGQRGSSRSGLEGAGTVTGAEAPDDDAPQDARAVAEAVEAACTVLPWRASHRHLHDAAPGAQHAEEQVHLDVEP